MCDVTDATLRAGAACSPRREMLNLAVADAATRKACMCASNDGNRLIAVRKPHCPAGYTEATGLVGVNVFEALWCGSPGMRSPCNYMQVLEALRFLAASGIRFFRFFASLYGPSQDEWLKEPKRFWRHFDRLMNDVQVLGLQVIPSIGAESWHEVANRWSHACNEVNFFCALEPAQHAVIAKSPLNNRGRYHPESVNDLVNNRSSLARKLAVRYTEELVRRYRDRPAVLFWELGNELNLQVNAHAGCGIPHGGGPDAHCFNNSAMVEYTRDLVEAIRRADSLRPVSSGFGQTRPTAWHQERCRHSHSGECANGGEGKIDTMEQWQEMVRFQNEAVDIASLHAYDGARGCWFGRGKASNVSTGCHRQSNMSVIEAAAVAVDAVGKPLYIGEYGGPPPNFTGPSMEHQAFPRALLNWQVEQQQRGRRARLRTLSSIWGWMCPAKRDSMRCIWGTNSTEWRSGEEGSIRMLQMLRWARKQIEGPPA